MSVFVVDVLIFMSLHFISNIEKSHRELKLFNLSFYFMWLLFGCSNEGEWGPAFRPAKLPYR